MFPGMHGHLLILVIYIFISQFVVGAKIDTVFFQNGNKITGEVKIMENNLLDLSTDDAGRIKIEWDEIDSIYIKQRIRIEHADGRISFGTLKPSSTPKVAVLLTDDMTPITLEHINIVRITTDNIKFLARIDGKLSAGFSYTKASDLGRFNFAGDIIYRHNMNQIKLDYSILTEQKDEDRNQKQNGGMQYVRRLPKNWFLTNRVSAESNSELGLQLRTSYILGGGNNLIYSNFALMYIAGGLSTNRETTSDTATYNFEGVIALNISLFRYSSPKLSFDIKGNVYPSFNDWGRIRTYVESTLSWEVLSDFYIKWSFYHEFDNRPLNSTGPLSDWAIGLLGIEYKI